MKIVALQPSVVLDRGFFQSMTILSKCRLPENFDVRISFVFTDAMCNSMDSIAGKLDPFSTFMDYVLNYITAVDL